MKPTMGSLFAGIGGFDLGFERAGFKTLWQVEINEYCRKVLRKHFPDAERYADIRECGAHNLKPVDVICGGFPCQDISNAGRGAGIDGRHSGLWSEMHRVIGELRPRFVVVENVAALLGRGMGRVLGDLSESGYDAEWRIVSASDVGAPHKRDRVWIVAYPAGARREDRWRSPGGEIRDYARWPQLERRSTEMADSLFAGLEGHAGDGARDGEWTQADGPVSTPGLFGIGSRDRQWLIEPNVGRVAYGVPNRVDRLKALGNSVVPQIPELIARRLRGAFDETQAC